MVLTEGLPGKKGKKPLFLVATPRHFLEGKREMPGCGHKKQWFFPFLFFLVVLRLIPFKGYFSSWNFSKANLWYFYCFPWHDRIYSLKCFCQLPSTISFLLAQLLVTCVLVAQSCPILCNPVDCSPPGSSVHGILQARILEWVAMPSSRGFSWPRDWSHISTSPALAGVLFSTSAT